MASKKSTSKKQRAPFIQRVTNKFTKLQTWVESTKKRFAAEPKGEVLALLADVEENVAGILDACGKLGNWTPPTRGPSFVVGDEVSFKKEALVELKKSGLYDDGALDGLHEVLAISGRKVKLEAGVFANVLVTKKAA